VIAEIAIAAIAIDPQTTDAMANDGTTTDR
jgi:hypothetical protein